MYLKPTSSHMHQRWNGALDIQLVVWKLSLFTRVNIWCESDLSPKPLPKNFFFLTRIIWFPKAPFEYEINLIGLLD